MSIRSTAFFVSSGGGPQIISATTDSITLVDFDTGITIGSLQQILATVDTLILADLDATIVIGTPLIVSATTDTLVIASTFVDITRTNIKLQASLFFSF